MSLQPRDILQAAMDRLRQTIGITDLRMQLDPFDVDDFINRVSFRDEAMSVAFGEADPQLRSDGGYDLDVRFGVFIAAMAQGRVDPDIASGDLRCSDLAMQVYAAINAEPYCGLAGTSIFRLGPQRVFASQLTNKKGLALVAVELSATIYEAVAPPATQAQFIGVAPETWSGFTVNGGEPQDIPETAP